MYYDIHFAQNKQSTSWLLISFFLQSRNDSLQKSSMYKIIKKKSQSNMLIFLAKSAHNRVE